MEAPLKVKQLKNGTTQITFPRSTSYLKVLQAILACELSGDELNDQSIIAMQQSTTAYLENLKGYNGELHPKKE